MDSGKNGMLRVYIKNAATDREESWEVSRLDESLRSQVKDNKLYIVSSIENGQEEFLAVHKNIWDIYYDLRDFYSHETPNKNMLLFCEENLKTCELLLAKHTEIEKRFYGQKLGANFDYDTDIGNIKKYIKVTEVKSNILQFVINALGEEEKVTYVQSIVIKLFLVECAYMIQMGTTLLVLEEILTKLRDTASAKKKLGIFEYRKLMKLRKKTIVELNNIGGQLNASRDLFYVSFAEAV